MNNKKDILLKITELTQAYEKIKSLEKNHKAKILVFDIETSLMKSYHWGIWEQNINQKAIIDDWFVISWSAKWLLEDDIMSDVLTPKEAIEKNDKRVVSSLYDLLNEADIVIAHNGKKFDIKKINARFFLYDMGLPSPVKVIDTLQQIRSVMALTSNRLDYIAKFKGLEGKLSHTGIELWIDSMAGDKEALDLMDKYCKQDVQALEDVYMVLRPYMKNHPNVGLFIDKDVTACHTCGSEDLIWDGVYTTNYNSYDKYQCGNCKTWGASRKNNGTGNKLVTKPINGKQ